MRQPASLCIGGSFNPIHHGHLLCSRSVCEQLGYAKALLIPSGQPPLKQATADMAPAADRLAMCRAAVEGVAGFEVSDIEIRLDAPSYTLNTARALRMAGQERVEWLIGSDILPQLPQWYQFPQLLDEVHFLVMARAGWSIDWSGLHPAVQTLRSRVVEVPSIQISSTEIRQRIARGLPIDFLTPEPVCRYIQQHRLYLSGSTTP